MSWNIFCRAASSVSATSATPQPASSVPATSPTPQPASPTNAMSVPPPPLTTSPLVDIFDNTELLSDQQRMNFIANRVPNASYSFPYKAI